MALTASLIIALFIIPPIAAFLFRKTSVRERYTVCHQWFACFTWCSRHYLRLLVRTNSYRLCHHIVLKDAWHAFQKRKNLLNIIISSVAIVFLLANYWRPLGFDRSIVMNLLFVSIICFGLLGVFSIFRIYYERILRWALQNRYLFLIIPATVLTLGIIIMRNTGKEFMPALNEGSFC